MAPQIPALLAAMDGTAGDLHLRERFGDLGPALSSVLRSWIDPFATAIQGLESTADSRAAARAIANLARLSGTFARDAVQRLADNRTHDADSGGDEHPVDLAERIDDWFREFSSSPEFDRARRSAAAAILDWLEHDRAMASSIVRALEPTATQAPWPIGDAAPERCVVVMCDGNATLVRAPSDQAVRTSVLAIPGFTTGAHVFDPAPERSVAHALAANGVDTWILDWGRPDDTDRPRTVANQLERIDRAVDAVREASNGRCPALAGHFHGGLLALLYCIRYPGKAGALVTLSTPVEFTSSDDTFADWLRACDGERLVDVFGNVPGPLVAALVAAISPMRWCGGGFLALLGGLDCASGAARIARFERARRFPPAFPGETFRGLYRAFYRDNAFAASGSAVIDGHRYDLGGLETPVLNVFARDDRIVPASASIPLGEWMGAALASNREHRGGHFDLPAVRESHDALLLEIAAWLIERSAVT